jgi:hypothetical protein
LSFTTELKVPPEPAFGSLVEAFAADAAERGELCDQQQRGLVTAACLGFAAIVGEALAREREAICLVAECDPLHLTLSFFERGLPMDDALARRDPIWNELCAGVDGAHWRLHGTAGSELRLLVKRALGIADSNPAVTTENDVPLAPEQTYVIRRFEPADALGVARAFYLTYGYAYDLKAVYVPARLIELNRSGRFISIVALAADGEIVGHYALAREGDEPIADACSAIVLPAHRGRDLLNRLRDRAEEEAVALGLAAYYSEPVTDHPRTQLASEHFGAKACGITLGEAPRNFLARHMQLSATTQRQSCMLYVKPLQARERRTVYPPPRHRAIVGKIYEQLDLPITSAEGVATHGSGRFREEVSGSDGTATIVVEAIGSQTSQLVGQAVDDLRSTRRLGAIYASLPLEDPGTPVLCESLEASGFFFSGVGPWMQAGRDALRLQMPLTPIDLSQLVVVGPFAQILVEYVASERTRRAAISL